MIKTYPGFIRLHILNHAVKEPGHPVKIEGELLCSLDLARRQRGSCP